MNPSPFEIAQGVSKNISGAFERERDLSAIDEILGQAAESNDPAAANRVMGQLLSRISPERQPMAAQIIQNKMSQLQSAKQVKSDVKFGLTEEESTGSPEIKKARINSIEAGRLLDQVLNPDSPLEVNSSTQDGTPLVPGQEEIALPQDGIPSVPGQDGTPSPQNVPGLPQEGADLTKNKPRRTISDLTDDQLVQMTAIPVLAEPAKQELKRRQEERKAGKSTFEPESEKLEAKRVSELATEIENDFTAAKNENLRLERQIKLDEKGNVSTPTLIRVMDAVGLPIGILSNPDTEEYRKLEADFLRDVSKVFPGGKITNYEIQSYLKTIPGLMNSPEGRKSIIRNRKIMNEAKLARYDEYKKILKENNGKKPQNLSILLEERTQEKIADIEDRFINGIEGDIEKFQQPIRMIDPNGNPVNIPPNMIEKAMQSGAKFS